MYRRKEKTVNILSPSLLAADFSKLGKEIKDITEGGAKYLHIDVMDGVFVPSISLGMPVIKSLRSITNLCFDVHLMIENPERYIENFFKCGADILTVHAEATNSLLQVVTQIKKFGMKAGIAINPTTPISKIESILEHIDMILVMGVNPGFEGQTYIPDITQKIFDLKEMIYRKGLTVDISVDGGIKLDNVREVINAGANIVVAGSAIFNEKTLDSTKEFMNVLKNGKYLFWHII